MTFDPSLSPKNSTGFGAALRFPFRGEKRWANIGFAAICFLIPVIGPIVLLGYGVLIEKALIANLDSDAPAFDFGQFSAHLKRGVAPFVVNLVFVPILMIIIFPVVFGMIVIAAMLQNSPVISLGVIALAILLELALITISTVVLTPMMLKAGLEQSIGGAFNFSFIRGFLQRVGMKTLGYNLLLMVFSMFVGPFSICILFVGIYFFTAYLFFVQFHIRAQLYLAYLQRGGDPLAIQPETLAAFPVMNTGFPPPGPGR